MATNSFTYNAAGDLRTLSDGKSQLISWGYDTFGRVTNKTNAANTEILRYSYYLNGALSNRWSSAKTNTVYSYDAANNLTNVNYAASTDIRYQYDALNRMTNMVDAAGTTTFKHDAANRFTVEDGPWANDAVTNWWNTAGLRSALNVQVSSVASFNTTYAYDAAKRLTNLTSGAGTYSYYYHPGLNSITAPSRLVHRISQPNTSYITNQFDSLARLTETALKQSSGTITNRHAYAYNNGHQRTQQTRTDGGYVDYLYDDAGQLYSAKTYNSGGGAVNAENRGYLYDPAWNLNKRTNNATVATFTVNNLNQLTSGGSVYDSNGNMTTGSSMTFAYDDENQLVEAINGSQRVVYTYDGKMRLRKRSYFTWNGSSWYPGDEIRYLYDGMLMVQERIGAGTATSYTRGIDLSGTFEGAGGIGGLLGRSQGANHFHYHADGNGNITFLAYSTQSIAASYKYDPYGNTISSSGAMATVNLFRFSSKLIDTTTGLYCYGYRWYSPSLQRWLNRDPIGEKGGINLYQMVKNNPLSYVDLFGLVGGWGIGNPVPPPPGWPGFNPNNRPALPNEDLQKAKDWLKKCHPELCPSGMPTLDLPISDYGSAIPLFIIIDSGKHQSVGDYVDTLAHECMHKNDGRIAAAVDYWIFNEQEHDKMYDSAGEIRNQYEADPAGNNCGCSGHHDGMFVPNYESAAGMF